MQYQNGFNTLHNNNALLLNHNTVGAVDPLNRNTVIPLNPVDTYKSSQAALAGQEPTWKYWPRRILIGKYAHERVYPPKHPMIRRIKIEIRRCLSEFFGALFLIYFICGIQVVSVVSTNPNEIGSLTKGVTSGFCLAALIYTFGQISGSHLNPVVTTAFFLRGLFKWWRAIYYIIAQFAGSIAAAGILRALFGNVSSLGATSPGAGISRGTALGMEIMLTCLLVTVVLTTAERGLGTMSPLAVGLVFVAIETLGWNISGASVNPWRSFAPTIVSGQQWHTIWIYFAGPIAGMACAVVGQRIFVSFRNVKVTSRNSKGYGVTMGDNAPPFKKLSMEEGAPVSRA